MYKYIGLSFIVGIPARDISADEFKAMDKARQEIIKNSALYELANNPVLSSKSPTQQSDDKIGKDK